MNNKMNNKGFTTVELILTMAIVIIVMTTITSVTYTYSDQAKYEEIINEITDYKNTVTKIIYDDILNINNNDQITKGKVTKIEKINEYNYKFITETNEFYNLQIVNNSNEVGIIYDGVKYIIPGSNASLISLDKVTMYPSDNQESDLYLLDIYFSHKNIDNKFKIHLIFSK